MKFLLIAVLLIPSSALGFQTQRDETDLDLVVKPQVEFPNKDSMERAKKVIDNYRKVRDALRQSKEDWGKGAPQDAATKAQLDRIEKELERLRQAFDEFIEELTEEKGEPKKAPDFATDADPEAYKDENGNTIDDAMGPLLQLAAAGICVYMPPYCPLAMAVVQMLGLNLDEVEKNKEVLGVLSRHAHGHPLTPGDLAGIAAATGLTAQELAEYKAYAPNPLDPTPVKLMKTFQLAAKVKARQQAKAMGKKAAALVEHLENGTSVEAAFADSFGAEFPDKKTKQDVIRLLNSAAAKTESLRTAYVSHARSLPPK